MTQIEDHGGPTETRPVTIFPIYVGLWSPEDPRIPLAALLMEGLPTTSFWSVVMDYSSQNRKITRSVSVQPPIFSPAQGDWSDSIVARTVASYVNDGSIPSDFSSIPAVFLASDVHYPGFGTQFCGYHSFLRTGQPFIFVQDPAGALENCSFYGAQTPLSYATTLTHELIETLTDPNENAWVSGNDEAGDVCAWQLPPLPGAPGGYYVAPNGDDWNLNVSGTLFLVQSIWDPATNQCSLGVSSTSSSTASTDAYLPPPPPSPTRARPPLPPQKQLPQSPPQPSRATPPPLPRHSPPIPPLAPPPILNEEHVNLSLAFLMSLFAATSVARMLWVRRTISSPPR